MAGVAERVEKKLREKRTIGDVELPESFVLPSYDGYGLANISPTILHHFGAKVDTPGLADEVVGPHLDGSRKVVHILLDACGYLLLKRAIERERDHPIHALLKRGRMTPLTSVFPSTTAVALSTLHTGLPPVRHGITGYRMYLPDRGVLANMIRLSPESDERPRRLIRYRDGAQKLIGVPTIHERLANVRVRSVCMLRKGIAWSGLSEIHCTGADVVPFVSAPDMFVTIRKMLAQGRPARQCIWAYWDALDTIQHDYGVWQDEGEAEMRSFAWSLKTELLDPVKALDEKVTVIFTADHGQVHVNASDVFELKSVGDVDRALRVPLAGTSRTGYLYTNDGQWLKKLERKLGKRGWVIPSSTVLEAGLWGEGEHRPELAGRIGDQVMLMNDRRVSFYPYYEGADPIHQTRGRHGGLHEDEMLTPFIIAKM